MLYFSVVGKSTGTTVISYRKYQYAIFSHTYLDACARENPPKLKVGLLIQSASLQHTPITNKPSSMEADSVFDFMIDF